MLFQVKLWIFIFFITNRFVRGDPDAELETKKTCFRCDSNNNDKCSGDPNKENKCSSKYCYIFVNGRGLFARGCIGDSFVVSEKDCKEQQGLCSLCSDEFCNGQKFQEHCHYGNYDVNEFPTEQSSKVCPIKSLQEKFGCYHMEKDNKVEKGCMSDLDEQKRKEYKKSPDCEICLEENCNSKVVRSRICFHCTDKSAVNCAEPSEVQKTEDFSKKSSSCLVGIDKNGFTHRLWGTNDANDNKKFPNGFEICHSDSCNIKIFPSNRLMCYQCQGNHDCHHLNANLQPKVCEIYASNDECYTYLDEEGTTIRGCLSDRTEGKKSCEKNDSRCTKCKESGCNKDQPNSSVNNVSAKFFIFTTAILSLFCYI